MLISSFGSAIMVFPITPRSSCAYEADSRSDARGYVQIHVSFIRARNAVCVMLKYVLRVLLFLGFTLGVLKYACYRSWQSMRKTSWS